MRRTIPVLRIAGMVLAMVVPPALLLVLRWDALDGPVAQPGRFIAGGLVYALFVAGVLAAVMRASDPARNRPPAADRPHWRTSHKAVAPNGSRVAEIARAMEHSMSNPTIGTLRISDGFELAQCSPAFLWSDDSRYLAVPRWDRGFLSYWQQRLMIVDVEQRTAYTSQFKAALLLPRTFERGKVEVVVSHGAGITFGWKKEPLVVEIPQDLQAFVKSGYGASQPP
jgi:hypothetical protein